jgi:hypothetical protein
MKSMDDTRQRTPREQHEARLSRIKTGILIASAAAFAAIGAAVATDGGGPSAAPAPNAVQPTQQDPGSFFGDDTQDRDQGGFFAPDQGGSGAPMLRSGGS